MLDIKRRREVVRDLIAAARGFRFCGPSDDPDEQTAVTAGYRHLTIQFKRLAAPVLSSSTAARLQAIDVEINNLYSAYDAKAELDAILPELEKAIDDLEFEDGTPERNESVLVAESRLVELRLIESPEYDFQKLIRMTEEMNLAYAAQCYYASAMLVRALLDHVPPIFGFKTFSEVANNYAGGGRSFKESMQHLEGASRKIADGHLHGVIRKKENLPTAHQVNCAQLLDVLLSEIIRIS
jgi:hypothetical protein